MYQYSKLPNTDYGIEGYETPALHFDHIKKAREDNLFKIAINKAKKPRQKPIDMTAQRNKMDKVEAKAKITPGPWAYDLELQWIHGNTQASKTIREVPAAEKQKLAFKWKGVPKDDQEVEKPKRRRQKKIDMSVEPL